MTQGARARRNGKLPPFTSIDWVPQKPIKGNTPPKVHANFWRKPEENTLPNHDVEVNFFVALSRSISICVSRSEARSSLEPLVIMDICKFVFWMSAQPCLFFHGFEGPDSENSRQLLLGVQTPSLCLCNEFAPVQAILGNFQEICLDPCRVIRGKSRQFRIILGNFGSF